MNIELPHDRGDNDRAGGLPVLGETICLRALDVAFEIEIKHDGHAHTFGDHVNAAARTSKMLKAGNAQHRA